jgi:hypothetical protein
VSSQGSREARRQRQEDRETALGWRILGAALGCVIALGGVGAVLVNSVQGMQATGLIGTPGTFTVEYCFESSGAQWSDYACGGTFVPDGGGHTSTTATLENGEDYPEDEQLDVTENVLGEGNTYRETGVLAVLGSLWWLCFGTGVLAGGFLVTRRWVRSFRS